MNILIAADCSGSCNPDSIRNKVIEVLKKYDNNVSFITFDHEITNFTLEDFLNTNKPFGGGTIIKNLVPLIKQYDLTEIVTDGYDDFTILDGLSYNLNIVDN